MRLRTLFPNGCGCKGIKGRPCTAIEVYENGYCKAHGGEGAPLPEWFNAKKSKVLKRFAARSKKLDRLSLEDDPLDTWLNNNARR